MYASSERKYRKIWDRFFSKYNLSHENYIEYLIKIYIEHYRRRFIKCYIDQVLHFETTITSRNENKYAQLKRHFNSFTEDLKIVIDNIKLLLINQIQNHRLELNDVKLRYLAHLRKLIFQQLFAFVTSTVINLMLSQYQLLTDCSIVFFFCINVFIKIMRLSCNHKMQKRLYQSENLLIENVHSHWR
jgi:radical SAM superfamily enzyme with C-terminal helix-hairpin-helix motif